MMSMAENESTPGDKNIIEDEPVMSKDLTGATSFPDKISMSSLDQANSPPVEAQPAAGGVKPPTRRRRVRSIVLYPAFLLIGIVLGVVGMLVFQLAVGGNKSPLPDATPTVSSPNVTVHADASIITPLLQNSVQQIALPANGSLSNVQVQFTNGTQMTITGNYQVTLLGVPMTQPFTLTAQLLVVNCQVQVHILQADFSNISVTGLVSLFEDKINQKLAQLIPQNTLPGNIELCLINVATDPQGITATFSVVTPSSPTPTSKTGTLATIWLQGIPKRSQASQAGGLHRRWLFDAILGKNYM
jgi:hypothetical protein